MSATLAKRALGRHPLGIGFVAPYVLFLAALFAYPLGYALWMSVHDFFFAAPGAIVERPFVGLDNFSAVALRHQGPAVVPEHRDLPGDQRAADGRALARCWRRR